MTAIQATDLCVDLSGRAVLRGIDLSIASGTVTSIIGPNGCGKSTLLRSLARIVRPASGAIRLDGADLWSMPPRVCARRLAFLPQTPQTPEGIRVRALIERGRTPYLGPFRALSAADRAAVDRAIAMTALGDLEDRRVDRLSGGQRQRAWIALALAQETGMLLLDEPTTFLDLPHQVDLLRLIGGLNRETGCTILMVLHDLNMAMQFSDRIVGLRDGRIAFDGTPSDVAREAVIAELFDMDVRIVDGGPGHAPIVMPR